MLSLTAAYRPLSTPKCVWRSYCLGTDRGQLTRSSSMQVSSERLQAWNRAEEMCMTRRATRRGRALRVNLMDFRTRALSRPSGRRSRSSRNPDSRTVRSSSRIRACKTRVLRLSFMISSWRSVLVFCTISRLTTGSESLWNHPDTVERGIPRPATIPGSPVSWTSSLSRGS